ncbi:ATP-binding protein [Cyanobium sp. BA20m-p-22]|uniref:ATP-binding protein n=1 Tax=Cyanobium sp. BA20m-p-22 TaxID=2823704 RepID=UPI0020CF9AB6|nr:ATP-binding protein [Cyanobium sp. BA20m-p-22]MCP9911580.1 ATP-binding protein [Cyanobium sp. BA20m-p-22]
MDPLRNPFAPGAGSRPPELAGRSALLEAAELALRRVRLGRAEKSQMLLGLRGVGKTVLLNRIAELAESIGYEQAQLEAPEGRPLATYLVPALKSMLLRLDRVEQARAWASEAMAALRGFAGAFKVSVGEVKLGLSEPVRADSGNLEVDLPELLLSIARAAQAAGTSVVILIDEVQYLTEDELRGLIVALHRIAQKGLPMILFGAGLPQLAALAGEAKSYAERLFDFPGVGALDLQAAGQAIADPIRDEGAGITAEALAEIVRVTEGYPYFLQEWGKHTWNQANGPEISLNDVLEASRTALAALDSNFFRVRFDRLTPREQAYLNAMAQLGAGPQRSGAIAEAMGLKVERTGPLRSGLIRKGMVWSHAHGMTAFTVPLFDAFMQRAMG